MKNIKLKYCLYLIGLWVFTLANALGQHTYETDDPYGSKSDSSRVVSVADRDSASTYEEGISPSEESASVSGEDKNQAVTETDEDSVNTDNKNADIEYGSNSTYSDEVSTSRINYIPSPYNSLATTGNEPYAYNDNFCYYSYPLMYRYYTNPTCVYYSYSPIYSYYPDYLNYPTYTYYPSYVIYRPTIFSYGRVFYPFTFFRGGFYPFAFYHYPGFNTPYRHRFVHTKPYTHRQYSYGYRNRINNLRHNRYDRSNLAIREPLIIQRNPRDAGTIFGRGRDAGTYRRDVYRRTFPLRTRSQYFDQDIRRNGTTYYRSMGRNGSIYRQEITRAPIGRSTIRPYVGSFRQTPRIYLRRGVGPPQPRITFRSRNAYNAHNIQSYHPHNRPMGRGGRR